MLRLSQFGIRQYGCCYVYDDADANGVVFKVHGYTMYIDKRSGNGVAVFPPHDRFIEDPITSRDFVNFTVKRGYQISTSFDNATSDTKEVIRHMITLVSI
jgi:hypothetical protein